jgi:hypothetical protein
MVKNKIEKYKSNNVFSSSSQSSQCVPQDVPNSITLLSHILCPKLSSFSPMYVGKRKGTLFFNKNFYFGEPSKVFFFFLVLFLVMGQSKWLIDKRDKTAWKAAPI